MSEDMENRVTEPRAAGVRREDRLQAGMTTAGVRAAAKREIESTFRVYVLEWTFDTRHNTLEEAQAYLDNRHAERLLPGHAKIDRDDEGGTETYVISIKVHNVRAEWKHEEHARAWAALLTEEEGKEDGEVHVVPRNSRSEHALKQYGKLKLAQARP
jgi:hypothetical protein